MTDKERQEAIDLANKERLAAIKERKAAEIKAGFLNPLGEGTSYAEFMAEVTKSKKTIAEYCKGSDIEAETIAWIEREINLINE